MQHLKKKKWLSITVLAILLLLFLGALIGGIFLVSAESLRSREVPGLRQKPDIPVESIPLRHDLPDHPHALPTDEDQAETPEDTTEK